MKKVLFVIFYILLITNVSANELSKSSSPYLLEHKDNPVEWHIWNKNVFLKAQKEKKPIFLSIGYSTCHWCHVMERESFENRKTAKLLNDNFISIKVDREEMPHLDSYYQNIYYQIYGKRAGWPLNIFMTPDKKVFFITGYIPGKEGYETDSFNRLIPKLHKLYLEKDFSQLRRKKLHKNKTLQQELGVTTLSESIKKSFDYDFKGFGNSSKFPQAAKLDLMLDLALLKSDANMSKEFFKTLDIMALRGVYDQVEGGFFRYSVERNWEIPHFEKMLYTQAELITLYTRGYIYSQKELYKRIVKESISMVDQHLSHQNLYYSASSADSEEKEGAYFVFTSQQIGKALKSNKNATQIKDALGFRLLGNFKDKIHLGFDSSNRPKGFTAFRDELLKVRRAKKYPFVDKKIITAWNAMYIEALYRASYIDKRYIDKANRSLNALKELMFKKTQLYHQTVLGRKPQQKGLLEDYSFFIAALIAGYEADYDEKKLDFAEHLTNMAVQKFYKDVTWYLSDDSLHIKAGLDDKYYTSAVSKMLQNLLKLASLKGSLKYAKIAKESMKNFEHEFKEREADTPALAKAYLMQNYGVFILKGQKSSLIDEKKRIDKAKFPYLLTKKEPYKNYLLCNLGQCFANEKSIKKILEIIDSNIRK